MSNKYTVK
jgi:hypothetical protein